jgi:hypothetical protein
MLQAVIFIILFKQVSIRFTLIDTCFFDYIKVVSVKQQLLHFNYIRSHQNLQVWKPPWQ